MPKEIVMGEGYVKLESLSRQDGEAVTWGRENLIGLNVTKTPELCRLFDKRAKQLKRSQPYRLVLIPIAKKAYDKRTRKELDAE